MKTCLKGDFDLNLSELSAISWGREDSQLNTLTSSATTYDIELFQQFEPWWTSITGTQSGLGAPRFYVSYPSKWNFLGAFPLKPSREIASESSLIWATYGIGTMNGIIEGTRVCACTCECTRGVCCKEEESRGRRQVFTENSFFGYILLKIWIMDPPVKHLLQILCIKYKVINFSNTDPLF